TALSLAATEKPNVRTSSATRSFEDDLDTENSARVWHAALIRKGLNPSSSLRSSSILIGGSVDGGADVRWHAAGGSSKEAHEPNPNAGYPAGAGSAGNDRSLGRTGRARGPLSAADAIALAASTLAEDALGSRSRVGRLHARPRLPGCPSFCDNFVA